MQEIVEEVVAVVAVVDNTSNLKNSKDLDTTFIAILSGVFGIVLPLSIFFNLFYVFITYIILVAIAFYFLYRYYHFTRIISIQMIYKDKKEVYSEGNYEPGFAYLFIVDGGKRYEVSEEIYDSLNGNEMITIRQRKLLTLEGIEEIIEIKR